MTAHHVLTFCICPLALVRMPLSLEMCSGMGRISAWASQGAVKAGW